MKSLVKLLVVVCPLVLLLTAGPAQAVCKLSIVLDTSDVMNNFRPTTGKTRCHDAQMLMLDAVVAYMFGSTVDLTTGLSVDSPDYDNFCNGGHGPAGVSGRLVDIWEMSGRSTPHRELTNGFVPAPTALSQIFATYFDFRSGIPAPVDQCDSSPTGDHAGDPSVSSPIADTIALAAQKFANPAATPPPGELRKMLILSHFTEFGSTNPCVYPFGTTEWEKCVQDAITQRTIKMDTRLFFSAITLPTDTGGSTRISQDEFNFWQTLTGAAQGTFASVSNQTVIGPPFTEIDSDGDGIPDYFDQCNGTNCPDDDHDGILNANDQCPTLAEDGRFPNPTDGCPDSDCDGFTDNVDACVGTPDPTHGCPLIGAPAMGFVGLLTLAVAIVLVGLLKMRGFRRQRQPPAGA
jgi:hypothetical protein